MKTTTSIKFYCRGCKADKQGQSPIEVSLTINGVRRIFTTNVKCDGKAFKTKPPKYILQYLDSMRVNIVTTIAQMAQEGIPLTTDRLRKIIQQGGIRSYTIRDLFNEYQTLLGKKVKGGSMKDLVARRYKYVATLFSKHIDFNREVTDITPAVIQNFFAYLQGNYQESTAAAMLTRLKTIIKYGMDNNYIKVNPFQNIRVSKHNKDITFLTKEEINKIISLNLENQSLSDVRDTFLLQAATGLSYIDIAELRKEDIQIAEDGTHYIIKNRHKTGIQFTTVILPFGVEVLKRHNYKLHIISNQKLNTYLKVIQKLADIKTNMTSHLARRTFACLLLNSPKKIRVEVVSKALGHSNVKQTMSAYAKILDNKVIEELKAVVI